MRILILLNSQSIKLLSNILLPIIFIQTFQ